MSKEHSKIIKVAKSNLLYSLTSLLLLVIGLCSMVLIWHPTFSKGFVWVFIMLFFSATISSLIIAVRTMEKTFRILKVSKILTNSVALVLSVIVILTIIILVIDLYG